MRTILQKRREEGFTIIEVLIVLAIFGLIMLIVFLAVPALQRNSRNTAIRNDVQNVLGGVSEYQGANNGRIPNGITSSTTNPGTVDYTGGNATTARVQGTTAVSTVTSAPATLQTGQIQVMLRHQCNPNDTNGSTPVIANTRAVAAFYSVETAGGGLVRQCADS